MYVRKGLCVFVCLSVSVYVCVCVRVRVCVYVSARAHTCVSVWVCVFVAKFVYESKSAYIRDMYTHTYKRTDTQTLSPSCTHTHTHTQTHKSMRVSDEDATCGAAQIMPAVMLELNVGISLNLDRNGASIEVTMCVRVCTCRKM